MLKNLVWSRHLFNKQDLVYSIALPGVTLIFLKESLAVEMKGISKYSKDMEALQTDK